MPPTKCCGTCWFSRFPSPKEKTAGVCEWPRPKIPFRPPIALRLVWHGSPIWRDMGENCPCWTPKEVGAVTREVVGNG